MGFVLACKAFFKALNSPEQAKQFVEGSVPKIESQDPSHLRLLGSLQEGGRLIDFLKEDITPFNDAQVGAAVRKIHQDCRQILEELVTIRPLKDDQEGAVVQIPKGYNPAEIKIIGRVKGEPPYSGFLVHRGWKAHKRSLPKHAIESAQVIYPAEVEVK